MNYYGFAKGAKNKNCESASLPSPSCTNWLVRTESVKAKQPTLLPPLSLLFWPVDQVAMPQNPKRKIMAKPINLCWGENTSSNGQDIELV